MAQQSIGKALRSQAKLCKAWVERGKARYWHCEAKQRQALAVQCEVKAEAKQSLAWHSKAAFGQSKAMRSGVRRSFVLCWPSRVKQDKV